MMIEKRKKSHQAATAARTARQYSTDKLSSSISRGAPTTANIIQHRLHQLRMTHEKPRHQHAQHHRPDKSHA